MKAAGLARIKEVLIAAVCLLIFAVILFPVFQQAKSYSGATCSSNLKYLARTCLTYAEDHDGRLMPRDSWMDATDPRARNRHMYQCPGLRKAGEWHDDIFGYSYDSRLELRSVSTIANPAETSMLFDSINLAKNASDPFVSLPEPPREHRGRKVSFVAYADGHATSLESTKE